MGSEYMIEMWSPFRIGTAALICEKDWNLRPDFYQKPYLNVAIHVEMFAGIIDATVLNKRSTTEDGLTGTGSDWHLMSVYIKNSANVQNFVVAKIVCVNGKKLPNHSQHRHFVLVQPVNTSFTKVIKAVFCLPSGSFAFLFVSLKLKKWLVLVRICRFERHTSQNSHHLVKWVRLTIVFDIKTNRWASLPR